MNQIFEVMCSIIFQYQVNQNEFLICISVSSNVLYNIKFNHERNEVRKVICNEPNLIIIQPDNINILRKLPNTLAT